ncbi:PAP2 superfamily protein [Amycolatopsis tolypomycina]|uniref:PAP2 superfamily protein n=1 Tax=Amycolatopsis tolypomycina TaxID=208445 RepID=A0A1H4XNQ9_9PSEU|nr:vanadium-dependent haloperoxidase [Amycolatopsis tolypomycina]SED07266.1 PAP2 superfamily protein [Amycolatopsis tolypomycina]
MQKIVLALVFILAAAGLSAPAAAVAEPRSDSVRVWNELALAAVRASRATDADAARTYAMLNVAVYDAVNGLAGPARGPALVPGPGPRGADPRAAAVAAAHGVLVRLDPDRTAGYDAQLQADLAALRPGHPRDAGVRWGSEVARRVVAARADDGSVPVQSQPAGAGPGVFRAEWSGVQYRTVRPFAVTDPAGYVPGPPPALAGLDYAAAFAEVALLGDAGTAAPDKLATYHFWSVPAGTDQPAGEWVKIALTVSQGRSLAASARLLALLTMTLADTTVPTVATKFTYRHWRPATAIREAETDGNPATQPNPNWAPRAGSTGGSPEYPSGHSSYSGAAAAVLAGFFCADGIPFTHTTDTAPGGQARTYPGFSAAAAEAGRSRVFGGQHFEFSNQAGFAIGRGVAAEVLATRLLKRTGPTHHGSCPL